MPPSQHPHPSPLIPPQQYNNYLPPPPPPPNPQNALSFHHQPSPQSQPQPPSTRVSAIHQGADSLLKFMLDERSRAVAQVEDYYQRQLQEIMSSWQNAENQLATANTALEAAQQRHETEKRELQDRPAAAIHTETTTSILSGELSAVLRNLDEADIRWDGTSLTFGPSWGDGRALSITELKSLLATAQVQARQSNDTESRLARLEASLGFIQPLPSATPQRQQQPSTPSTSSHPSASLSLQIPQKRDSISEEARTDLKRMKLDDAAQSMPSPVASPRVVPKIVSPSSKPMIESAPITFRMSVPTEPTTTAMNVDQHTLPPSSPIAPTQQPSSGPSTSMGVQRGPRSKIPMPGATKRTN